MIEMSKETGKFSERHLRLILIAEGLTFNELPVHFTVSTQAIYDLRSTDPAISDTVIQAKISVIE